MYKEADLDIYYGRVDPEDKALGLRWHQCIQMLSYPYTKTSGVVFFGFASHEGVKRNQGREGSREGPRVLKQGLSNFAYHQSPLKLYDGGEVICKQNLEEAQIELSEHLKELILNQHFPIVFGGGHEVAYASFLGLEKALKNNECIGIINFDAHFDLRSATQATSGTPFKQAASLYKEKNKPFSYLCLGLSKASNTQALFKEAKHLGVEWVEDLHMSMQFFEEICQKIDLLAKDCDYLYLSLDADVLEASIMPAVSAVAGHGISLEVLKATLTYIFEKHGKKVKLFDIAEFSPKYDVHNIAQKVLTRLVYDVVELVKKEQLV